jgi:hypothetical protein
MNRRDFLKSRVSYCSRQFSFLVAIRLKQPTFNEDGPGSRRGVSGTSVVLKRLGEADDLSSSDAIIVESPVYVGNMSGGKRRPGLVAHLSDSSSKTKLEPPIVKKCLHLRPAHQSPTVRKSRYLLSSGLCLATR